MDPATLAAVVSLAALGVGIVFLGVRLAGVHDDLETVRQSLADAVRERDKLRDGLVTAGRENQRLSHKLSFALEDQGRRLRYLRDQLDQCGDPEIRGRIAVDGIVRLLQSLETDDADPHDASRLLTDDDATSDR